MQKEKQLKSCCKKGCFPARSLCGVSRFFVSDGTIKERSKIGRCRITAFRQNSFYYNGNICPTLYPALKHCGMTSVGRGFTLIELLVVVLIIGILAAVALPQYQKAVEKSKATQAITLLKAVSQAADMYYVANGTFPASLEDLDIEFPRDWTGNEKFWNEYIVDARSNGEWTIELQVAGHNTYILWVGRLTGKYRGTGFGYYPAKQDYSSLNIPSNTLLCAEVNSGTIPYSGAAGSYCEKMWQGHIVYNGTMRIYTFLDSH